MDDAWIPIIIVPVLFIGLPWLILHYVTSWKASSRLTAEDETMLDELYELARRLDDRMHTIERIIQADNPGWTSGNLSRGAPRIEHSDEPDFRPRQARAADALDLVKRGRS